MPEAEPNQRRARLRLAGDDVVVELARLGDRLAFEELVRRRAGAVRSLLRRLSGNAALADDLGQETFLAAWRGLSSLRTNDAIGGWLRRIAVRIWSRHRARGRLLGSVDAALHEGEFVEPAAAAVSEAVDTRRDLDSALARLAPMARTCMILAYQGGMSHGEIAAATGLPLGTVKTHINRSTQQLREWFGVTPQE